MARGFAKDPELAVRAGHLGGCTTASIPDHMAEIGQRGGLATSAGNRDYMSEIGKRGGRASAVARRAKKARSETATPSERVGRWVLAIEAGVERM